MIKIVKLIILLWVVSLYGDTTAPVKSVSGNLNDMAQNESLFIKEYQEQTSCKIECPVPKDDYFFRIKDVKFREGITECYVYKKDTPYKVVATVSNKNKHCISHFDFQLSDSDYASLGIDTSDFKDDGKFKGALKFTQYSDLSVIFDKYFKYYSNVSDKKFINMPHYMIAGLTADSKIINLKDTIKYNELTLNSGYTLYPNAQTNSEEQFQKQFEKDKGWLATKVNDIKGWFGAGETADTYNSNEAKFGETTSTNINVSTITDPKETSTILVSSVKATLSSSVLLIINFLNEYNQVMLIAKTSLIYIILPVTVFFTLQNKLTKYVSKVSDHDDIAEKLVMAVVLFFIFFLSTTNIKTIEDKKISQTNFQNWFRPIMYKGADTANLGAQAATRAYLYTKLRDVGIAPQNALVDTYKELQILQKEQMVLSGSNGILDQCYNYYKTDKMREYIGSRLGLNQTFPQSENIFRDNAKFAEGGISRLNFYTTGEDGYLKDSPTKNNSISASGCYRAERNFLENKKKIATYQKMLQMNKNAIDDEVLKKQIDLIANMQSRNIAELGFAGLPMLATTSIMIDNVGIFNNTASDKQDKENEQILKDYRSSGGYKIGGLAESEGPIDYPINWLLTNSPYLIVPGADKIKDFYSNILENEESIAQSMLKKVKDAAAIGSLMIPGTGKFVEVLLNGLDYTLDGAVKLFVIFLTIITMIYIVAYLPLLAMASASFLVIFFYYFSVEVYYLVAPFLIAFAFATTQLDIVKNFLKVGLILSFKPLLFVISVVLALWAKDFFENMNFMITSWQFDQMFALTHLEGEKTIQSFMNGNWLEGTKSGINFTFIDIGLIFLKGFLLISNLLIGTAVIFYLILNGASMILDMFGIKDAQIDTQGSIGQSIDNRASKWTNPM